MSGEWREEPRWIRHRPERHETLLAWAAGLAAGLVVGRSVFYLTRLMLAREQLAPPTRGEREVP